MLDAPGRGIMSESKTQQEPSMEEILASIRRIISEDGDDDAGDADRDRSAATDTARKPGGEEPALTLAEEPEDDPADPSSAEDDDEPLELSDIVEDEPEPEPAPGEDEGDGEASADDIDSMFASTVAADDPLPSPPEPEREAAAEPPPRAARPEPPPRAAPHAASEDDDALISPETETAAGAAFARLMEQKVSREATMAARTALGNGDKTLEELVKDLLRPMLRDWLDTHLPDIVERVVEREVERVGRSADRR